MQYFWTFLFGILVILKLMDIISWSWWLVTFPLWLPFIVAIVVVGVLYVVTFDNKQRRDTLIQHIMELRK